MINEYANGYKIVLAVGFDNGYGFAFGIDPKAEFAFGTWQYSEQDGKKTFYGGQYFFFKNLDSAKLNYAMRVNGYKNRNPGIEETYNYLAAAEMNDEDNYNMIDGIINNISKPSLLEQIREYERRIAESRKDDTDATPKLCCPSKEEP
jgi:hypothetical protein